MLLILNNKNEISTKIIDALGLDSSNEKINFEDIINAEIKLILNKDYYKSLGDYYIINTDFESLYNSDNAITLKISGIIRGKEDKKTLTQNSSGLSYTEELINYIIEQNKDSEIVNEQRDSDYNILTGQSFTDDKAKNTFLAYLGADSIPVAINVYPKDFKSKEKITNYLDKYNKDKNDDDKILYNDLGEMISSLSGNIMDAITIVLIAFSAISLIVSSIMIGIITYISVLERTKEIGILRALGARKKDIARVFNAETFIIGICSGVLGIVIARILIFPINIVIENLTDLANVAKMNPIHATILISISVLLTIIGGYIPAKIASKKEPVEALRTE